MHCRYKFSVERSQSNHVVAVLVNDVIDDAATDADSLLRHGFGSIHLSTTICDIFLNVSAKNVM